MPYPLCSLFTSPQQEEEVPAQLDDAAIATYLPLADYLASQIQWMEEDHDDLVQVGMMALLVSFREYRANGKVPRDLFGLASWVMAGWMKWYYTWADRASLEVQILEWAQPSVIGLADFAEQVYNRAYYEAVEKGLGPIAASAAHQLLEPANGKVLELAVVEMDDKKKRHASGERVRGHSTLVVKHDHIRIALGLDGGEWFRLLNQLRKFTRVWVGEPSYQAAASAA